MEVVLYLSETAQDRELEGELGTDIESFTPTATANQRHCL